MKQVGETAEEVVIARDNIIEEELNPIQEKLNKIEAQYSSKLRQKIESVSDEKYRQAILDDDAAIDAINFFNDYGYADLLLDKKIALQEFGLVKLYDILKNYNKEIIEDYIKNVTDPRNDNAIAFIVTNNIEDIATGFSAFIALNFNIPYFIISYKDGSVFDSGTNLTLDEIDEDWKTKGIYPYLSPFIEELNNSRAYGETENIKIDKTKEEILDYLKKLLKQYGCIYFFSNGHENSSSFLIIYSSEVVEKLSSFELYEAISATQGNIIFKRIGNNCGDGFDIGLNSYLAKEDDISFSLLSSSKGKKLNMSPNILDAIAFSMEYSETDLVTIEELKKLGKGEERVETYVQNKRSIDSFETSIPDYKMELDSGGPADFEPELRTNTKDKSIFYIKLNYFRISN
ncbi:MAG: hypothetical protein MUP02_05525 [Actinobacteria bacterium]|nr:hypothetical protein [Actinomycetota bacterium]